MNSGNEKGQELQATLEDLLVRQFRACQALCAYTKEERAALTSDNVQKLADLVEKKESLLDEITTVEESRRMIEEELAEETGFVNRSSSFAELLARLEPAFAGRLTRLRDGILALSVEIRDLTSGNLALATTAIERNDAVQSFLLSLCTPQVTYQPPGTANTAVPAAWNVDRGA